VASPSKKENKIFRYLLQRRVDRLLEYKTCSKCREEKEITSFYKRGGKRSDYNHECKSCSSQRNKEAYLKNKDKIKERNIKWKKENKGIVNSLTAKRKATKLNATPAWANEETIKNIYKVAKKRGQHVDHIVPLINSTVCGLHCEDNLQLLDPIDNLTKGNRLYETSHN